jgi:hypothetical protein
VKLVKLDRQKQLTAPRNSISLKCCFQPEDAIISILKKSTNQQNDSSNKDEQEVYLETSNTTVSTGGGYSARDCPTNQRQLLMARRMNAPDYSILPDYSHL